MVVGRVFEEYLGAKAFVAFAVFVPGHAVLDRLKDEGAKVSVECCDGFRLTGVLPEFGPFSVLLRVCVANGDEASRVVGIGGDVVRSLEGARWVQSLSVSQCSIWADETQNAASSGDEVVLHEVLVGGVLRVEPFE